MTVKLQCEKYSDLASLLHDDKQRAAAVSIYSPSDGHQWGVMVAFHGRSIISFNGQIYQEEKYGVEITLGPPEEKMIWEFLGLVHCSPKQLIESANTLFYHQQPPFNETWACEYSALLVDQIGSTQEAQTNDSTEKSQHGLHFEDNVLFAYFTGGPKGLTEMSSRDSWVRRTKVYLYSRPMREIGDPGGFLASRNAFRHWGAIVAFDHGKAYAFDGTAMGGKNMFHGAFFVWVTPGWPDGEGAPHMIELIGEVECSPKKLFELGCATLDNRPEYGVLGFNCQTWAISFCEQLVITFGIVKAQQHSMRTMRKKTWITLNEQFDQIARLMINVLLTVTYYATGLPRRFSISIGVPFTYLFS